MWNVGQSPAWPDKDTFQILPNPVKQLSQNGKILLLALGVLHMEQSICRIFLKKYLIDSFIYQTSSNYCNVRHRECELNKTKFCLSRCLHPSKTVLKPV